MTHFGEGVIAMLIGVLSVTGVHKVHLGLLGLWVEHFCEPLGLGMRASVIHLCRWWVGSAPVDWPPTVLWIDCVFVACHPIDQHKAIANVAKGH